MQTLAYSSHFAYSVIDRLSLRWTEFRRAKGGGDLCGYANVGTKGLIDEVFVEIQKRVENRWRRVCRGDCVDLLSAWHPR